MGCSLKKRGAVDDQKALQTNIQTPQVFIQCEMPDSNRDFMIYIRMTLNSKGMVDRQNQMYPDKTLGPDIVQVKLEGQAVQDSQNVCQRVFSPSEMKSSSQTAKSICVPNFKPTAGEINTKLRGLLRSNTPRNKKQKNVTFQLSNKVRSPISVKQSKRKRVTIEHLERIF